MIDELVTFTAKFTASAPITSVIIAAASGRLNSSEHSVPQATASKIAMPKTPNDNRTLVPLGNRDPPAINPTSDSTTASAIALAVASSSLPTNIGRHVVGRPRRKSYVCSSCSSENKMAAAPAAYSVAAASATHSRSVGQSTGGASNTPLSQSINIPSINTASHRPRSVRYSFHTNRRIGGLRIAVLIAHLINKQCNIERQVEWEPEKGI